MSENTFSRKSVLSFSSSAAKTVVAKRSNNATERRRNGAVDIVGGVNVPLA
jgi:hypothetical protein